MTTLLNLIGDNLADLVLLHQRPQVPLDIDYPRIQNRRLFDWMLVFLASRQNSLFFVGKDLDYLNAYINSLAVLMNHPDDFVRVIRSRKGQFEDEILPNRVEWIIEHLAGKRLHTLHVEKLLSLFTPKTFNDLFVQLINETKERNYFLAIDQIHRVFPKGGREDKEKWRISANFFVATQGSTSLTFIAPLTWHDYVQTIEGTTLSHRRRPLFFNPRPIDLPYVPFEYLEQSPDIMFDFGDHIE